MTRRGEGGVRKPGNAILTGSAAAIRTAYDIIVERDLDVRICAAAVVGPGDAPVPVITRAPAWDAIAFAADETPLVVLAEPPPSTSATRAVLKHAADARKRIFLLDQRKLRPLAISDLIGRQLGAPDWARIGALIAGKRVLITGGGGSIGAELARRVATLSPARLTLFDSSEFNLYNISRELPDAVPVLADVRDLHAVRRWFARERPHIVFHAAALKQVPLVEAFPSEGVLTNVLGLRNVAEAADAIGADLIFVSTDKAVDPSGMMGASKRLGELYCQALDRLGGARRLPVRLGNVLGSAGSVTPIFEAQLAGGGPLTVTDADVTRFFISIPQAADVLLQAAALSLGDDATRGAALTVDMGDALPVVELARDMIRLQGLRPDIDVSVAFVGLRPGEKLHEHLVATDEWRELDPAPGLIAACSDPRGLSEVREIMDQLTLLAREGADAAVAEALLRAVAPVRTAEARAVG